MRQLPRVLFATAIVLTLVVIGALGWYHLTGWAAFAYHTGANPGWAPTRGANTDVTRLRFKNCVFTVRRADGVTASANVTANLNAMATGLKGSISIPPALTLTRPLNPFSFVITGFNDPASVPDPAAAPWCTAGCPATATATLTGEVRTI